MKKKIVILGSTGSIGKNLFDIIQKDKENIDILLLSTNKNYKEILKQKKIFNVKNIIITDKKTFSYVQNLKIKNLNLYKDFNSFKIILKKKADYVMNAISGLDGLEPTLKIIQYSKTIAVANKESIICGWNLIKKKINQYNTNFIPVDSEHFSIWSALDNNKKKNIEKIYLTASGGPFLKLSLKELNNVTIKETLKHPNWNMGKKISVDSATMINKVFEVIEAKNIFEIPYSKLSILIHEDSYLHALIKFNDGMINIIAHDTTMKIPIFNSIYFNQHIKKLKTNKIDIKKLNKINLKLVDYKKFPINKILKLIPENFSLFETIVVVANDFLVELYLKKKIKFLDIYKYLLKILNLKDLSHYKYVEPKNLLDIINLKHHLHNKINNLIE